MNKHAARNMTILTIMALLSGWIGVGVDQLPGLSQPVGSTLGMLLWLLLPLLTVILLRSFFGDGWRDSGLAPRFRSGWALYGLALMIYPLIMLIVLLAGWAAGGPPVSELRLSALAVVAASALPGQLIKNVCEELVWRGYLTAKLAQGSLSDWGIYAIIGVVWGLWHLPYYLIFLPDETLSAVLPVSRNAFAVIALVSIAASSIVYVELFRISRSIWPCVLMHAVENALLNPLVTGGYASFANRSVWLSPSIGLLTALLALAAGLLLRSARIRRSATPSIQRRATIG
ncbi:CPBP family intramembrane metalloprotease [Paenibacillus athensensis]|nr:CPBP family intramembrane glutamic endopeptidase [Paenibacillus athensensis]MCD1260795.1 CPBP family intramembrane metalloprotease [Paenibacillus athensensis]